MARFYDHSEVFYLWDVELAFLELQVEVKFSHVLEDTTGLLFMSFWVRGGDEEVVHVGDEPSFSNHVSKRVIHELLECGRGIAETKKHDCWFKSPLCVMKATFY